MKLNASQLRKGTPGLGKEDIARQEIYIILDDILDTYNIGSIFRVADAVAAKKIYLCKGSVTPPNHRIAKASVNTTEWIEWEYCPTAVEAIQKLRMEVSNIQIVAVEQSDRSTAYDQLEYRLPICLVVGHETTGVSKEALDLVDAAVELPMFGINISLNVMVSLAIVAYEVIERAKR